MDAHCLAVNPAWHKGCACRIVIPATGPVHVVCDSCLCVASVADTWGELESVRGKDAVYEFRRALPA